MEPDSSIAASVWSLFDIICIVLSTTFFILEAEPDYAPAFKDHDHSWYCPLHSVSVTISAFFTVDYVLRAATSPDITKFFKTTHNIVDLLAILPFYAKFWMDDMAFLKCGKALRILRLFRVTKMFRLYCSHSLIYKLNIGKPCHRKNNNLCDL